MKISKNDIMTYIIAGIITIIAIPFMLLYQMIMPLFFIPKYGIRLAFLKYYLRPNYPSPHYVRSANGHPVEPTQLLFCIFIKRKYKRKRARI